MSSSPHEEFLALCAISTSGELTEEERRRLHEHLLGCPSCREAKEQYESVVRHAVPSLAVDTDPAVFDSAWSSECAERELFERLREDETFPRAPVRVTSGSLSAAQAAWRNVWTLYAAGILLFVALGLSAYQVGVHRGTHPSISLPLLADENSLQRRLTVIRKERDILQKQMVERDRTARELQQELDRQSAEVSQLRIDERRLDVGLSSRDEAKQALQTELYRNQKDLEAAQAESRGLREELKAVQAQSLEETQRKGELEAKVFDLNRLLRDRESALEQQEELLAHDRDIRDLMGARDLYIAEVYDVARDGKTKKPYGRVFYTRGKSLVFYAYDLDQQTEVKNASTFQAWGRRGPDRQQAINLGVFFEDSASKKRWVLRSDDPKMLAQIDAVFVTVEPNGGSHKPTGKSLLFAYLKIDPNHP